MPVGPIVPGGAEPVKPLDDTKAAEAKSGFNLGLSGKQKHDIVIKMIKKSVELRMLQQMQKHQKKMKQISKGNA